MGVLKIIERRETGQGLVEYGLILALVSVVAVGALGDVGGKVANTFGAVSEIDIDTKVDDGYVPIASADDLNNIRSDGRKTFGAGTKWEGEYDAGLDKNYIQITDIDLDHIDDWQPIGSLNKPYKGSYDGGGFEINNLSITNLDGEYVGLFGKVYQGSIINVGINDGLVKGNRVVGGLVGKSTRSEVLGSYYTGKVIGEKEYTGGLIGHSIYGIVKDSYSNADVIGGSRVGGLLGDNGTNQVLRSYATGKVTGTTSVGGLVGWNNNKISDSYATGSVVGDKYVGGAVGYNTAISTNVITNIYSVGSVKGEESVGGLLGKNSFKVINSYYDNDTSNQSDVGKGLGKSTIEMKEKSEYDGWNFDNVWDIKGGQYPSLR